MRARPIAVAALLAALAAAGCQHTPSRKERETAEIHYNLSLEALRARRFTEALREVEQALAVDAAFADAYLARGLVLEFGYGKDEDA